MILLYLIHNFPYSFWLCWIFIAAWASSVVAVSRGDLLVGVLWLLIVVASLVVECGLQAFRLR